jgi:hypothetical protein
MHVYLGDYSLVTCELSSVRSLFFITEVLGEVAKAILQDISVGCTSPRGR